MPLKDPEARRAYDRAYHAANREKHLAQASEHSSFHVEHIVPLARGGHHTYENVSVSHPLCNHRKGVRPWPS